MYSAILRQTSNAARESRERRGILMSDRCVSLKRQEVADIDVRVRHQLDDIRLLPVLLPGGSVSILNVAPFSETSVQVKDDVDAGKILFTKQYYQLKKCKLVHTVIFQYQMERR